MGRVKNFLAECASLGHCPISAETDKYLEGLETSHDIDWIGYTEAPYTGKDGQTYYQDSIDIESAFRLCEMNLANVEIANFIEYFGGFASRYRDSQNCPGRCGADTKPKAPKITIPVH